MNEPEKQMEFDFAQPPVDDCAPPPSKRQSRAKLQAEFDDLLAQLTAEFHRLNETHLNGKYKCPVIEFSTRKTFGGYYQKKRHRIVLSWQAYVEHGWDETLNTFRHEVAHIVHLPHNRDFWELAAQLGTTRKYAANPIVNTRSPQKMFVYACPVCGGLVRRRKRLRNASCARCDRNYNPKFKLKLVQDNR
ncbi:MAG: hypothetical protein P4L33_09380 [Capsulimonadaceae bacterium]|nr:hypothetical protein [Capsulimonadaceae bacterium]